MESLKLLGFFLDTYTKYLALSKKDEMYEIESRFQIYKFYLLKMLITISSLIFSNMPFLFVLVNDKVYVFVGETFECLNDGVNLQNFVDI